MTFVTNTIHFNTSDIGVDNVRTGEKTQSNNSIMKNTLSRVCPQAQCSTSSYFILFIFSVASAYHIISFYLNNVKRAIVSLIVYKWLLLLQITVTVFYALLRQMENYNHKLYLSKACPEYPFTLLKRSKKAHYNRRVLSSGLICTFTSKSAFRFVQVWKNVHFT